MTDFAMIAERDANQRLLDADATEIQRLRDRISGLEAELARLRAGTPWRVCVDAERDADVAREGAMRSTVFCLYLVVGDNDELFAACGTIWYTLAEAQQRRDMMEELRPDAGPWTIVRYAREGEVQ